MIVVTGGSGFIGSNLIAKLNRMSITDIIVVDLMGERDQWKNLMGLDFEDYIDADSFMRHFGRFSFKDISMIYHLGAVSDTTCKDGKKVMYYNYEYTRKLIDTSQFYKGTGLVYASSASVYGNSDPQDEDATMTPLCLYAYSKALVDAYVVNTKPTGVVGLRLFNVYGKNEEHKGNQASPVSKFISQIEEHGTVKLFEGSSAMKRDFIHVDDVVHMMTNFPDKRWATGIYNLGTGRELSFQKVAEIVTTHYGGDIEYITMPESIIPQYQWYTKADTHKLLSTMGDYSFARMEDVVEKMSNGEI